MAEQVSCHVCKKDKISYHCKLCDLYLCKGHHLPHKLSRICNQCEKRRCITQMITHENKCLFCYTADRLILLVKEVDNLKEDVYDLYRYNVDFNQYGDTFGLKARMDELKSSYESTIKIAEKLYELQYPKGSYGSLVNEK